MKIKYFLPSVSLMFLTTTLFSQDFILTETYAELDFNAIRTYSQTKITDFRLDPIIREKLMPYYRNAIKEQGIMMEVHSTSLLDYKKNERLLDSAVCKYDKEGRLTSISVSNGIAKPGSKPVSLFFDYDKKGDLIKIRGDKKTLRSYTRDKNGKITRAGSISYTYKKGELQKVGKISKDGNYLIDAKNDGQVFDMYEIKYDEYGRPRELRAHEAEVSLFYDTSYRWVNTDGGAESFNYNISIEYKDGLMFQLQETNNFASDDMDSYDVVTTTVYRIYRDGK